MSDDAKLNDRVDTVADKVIFTKRIQSLIDDGSLVLMAVFLYRPKDDALVVCRPTGRTAEEVEAMFRKFDFPHTEFEDS